MKTGLFVGRFQPFHNGHLHIIKEAFKEVDNLVIGACYGNNKNPFNIFQTVDMIHHSLFRRRRKYMTQRYVVQCIMDKHNDRQWVAQLEDLPKIDIIFIGDKNTKGEQWVEGCLKNKYVIKKIKPLENVSGTEIRKRIREGREWKQLVPTQVYKILNEEAKK